MGIIVFGCLFLVCIIMKCCLLPKDGFLTDDKLTYNQNVDESDQYHKTESQIRESEKHPLNVLMIKDKHGKVIEVKTETTQPYFTFYTPGSYMYGASNYIPTYEAAVKLSTRVL